MPASKHRRRGKPRPRWMPLPRPPHRPITEEDRREDALLDERLHRLFGPPITVKEVTSTGAGSSTRRRLPSSKRRG